MRLRYGLALSILVIPTSTLLAQADVYPISPRVGAEISAEERAYFGLFPNVDGFEEARFTEAGDSVRMVIRFDPSNRPVQEVAWTTSRAQAAALGAYVEAFEGLSSPLRFPQWQTLRGAGPIVLAGADVPTPAIAGDRPDVRVLVGSARYEGLVLAASDTLLLLHPAGRPYDWRAPTLFALDPRSVDWVTVVPARNRANRRLFRVGAALAGVGLALPFVVGGDDEGFFKPGGEAAVAGALAGGVAVGALVGDYFIPPGPQGTGTYADRLPNLQARARFGYRFPFDLPPGEAAARARAAAPPEPEPAAPRGSLRWRLAEWRRAYGVFNVAVLGPGGAGGQPGSPTFEERLSGRPEPFVSTTLREGMVPSVGLDVALRPLPWVRLGATWQSHDYEEPAQQENFSIQEEVARTDPGPVRAYAEAVLPTPRAGGYGLELAAGGGIEQNRLAATRDGMVGTRPLDYRFEEMSTNSFLQGTVELVTPRRASFFLRYTRRTLPSLTVEEVVYPGVAGGPPAYRMEAHELDFGYHELIWGTRFRF
ncbi:MAG TPA: hypothetical protein VD962_02625 [Rubricoccaceae bacterium]|nr:hypothetical protein [Rubricoccaceae bacterium]